MIALLILALTVLSLSAGTLAASWRRYGQAALSARQDWRDCPQTREVRFQIIEYGAKPNGKVVGQVIALPVRPKAAPALHRQPLRAAA
ncbi:MAG: hypothetical protein RL339_3 [Pseudomonadota bacterium]